MQFQNFKSGRVTSTLAYPKQFRETVTENLSMKSINQTANQPDFKNIQYLRRFITEQGKIRSRRSTGISAKEQRKITKAIKQARLLGLLQFVQLH